MYFQVFADLTVAKDIWMLDLQSCASADEDGVCIMGNREETTSMLHKAVVSHWQTQMGQKGQA